MAVILGVINHAIVGIGKFQGACGRHLRFLSEEHVNPLSFFTILRFLGYSINTSLDAQAASYIDKENLARTVIGKTRLPYANRRLGNG